MSTRRRRLVLVAALLLTLWAAWEVSQPQPDQEPARRKRSDQEPAAIALKRAPAARQAPLVPTLSGDLRFPDRREVVAPVTDLFEIPGPPPPRLEESGKMAAALAPPLPYVYLGRLEEAGRKQIYLAEGSVTRVVGAGARLAGGWRLESIEAGRVIFVYEPLGQRQSLQIREY